MGPSTSSERQSVSESQSASASDASEHAVGETRERAELARRAGRHLAQQSGEVKNRALEEISRALIEHAERILEANARDVEREAAAGMSPAMQDRLRLSQERIRELADSLQTVIGLPDPVGVTQLGRTLENGLRLRRISVPLGVIACIYEARPNVTVDIAALALKAGNAVLLRGGSAAQEGNRVLIEVMREALQRAGVEPDAVQSMDDLGRPGVDAMLDARGLIDLIIPRGGAGLIQHVARNSKVPVIATGEGNVHLVLDESADAASSVDVVLNSKTQRLGTCNTAETMLLIGQPQAAPAVLTALLEAGVRLHADEGSRQQIPESAARQHSSLISEATEQDWATEYLDMDLAVRTVGSLDEAMEHISRYSTGHTESILTQSLSNAERFQREVDSASVMVNASTRFTDGAQFGLGAEVGISTDRLHARGPMGVEELTTSKWLVNGEGHIRP